MFVGALAASEEPGPALLAPAAERVVLALETDGVVAGALGDQVLQLRAGHLTQLEHTGAGQCGRTGGQLTRVIENSRNCGDNRLVHREATRRQQLQHKQTCDSIQHQRHPGIQMRFPLYSASDHLPVHRVQEKSPRRMEVRTS